MVLVHLELRSWNSRTVDVVSYPDTGRVVQISGKLPCTCRESVGLIDRFTTCIIAHSNRVPRLSIRGAMNPHMLPRNVGKIDGIRQGRPSSSTQESSQDVNGFEMITQM